MWDCFRKLSGVTAFCEVFNEALASIKKSEVDATSHSSWSSNHPVGAAYFLEFTPLITDSGGVARYDRTMSFARFIPEGGIHGDISKAEKEYLASLIAHADKLGTVPVLSCTRTLGRLPALKRALPGLHILIYRNLFRQWCSYTEQYAQGNKYFFNTIRLCLDNSSHDSFCRQLQETFGLKDSRIDSREFFCAFVLLHTYLYAQVADSADVIFDVERAVADKDYAKLMQHEIRSRSGLPVDLSGIKARIGFSFLDSERTLELRDSIKVLADIAISMAPSSAGRQFALKVLSGLMEEWDKYSFYAGALSTIAGPRGLLGARDTLAAERDTLAVARNAAVEERDAAVAARDALRTEQDGMTTARDTAVEERNAVVAERDALRAERDALVMARETSLRERNAVAAERNALRGERDALVMARETTVRERSALVTERDTLRAERDALAMARETSVRERSALVTERDTLRAERDALAMARSAAAEERNAVAAERDALRAERDALAMARETSVRERNAVLAERDALRAERAAFARARNTAVEDRNAAVAERDALRAERNALVLTRETSTRERSAAVAEREALQAERATVSAERTMPSAKRDSVNRVARVLRRLRQRK